MTTPEQRMRDVVDAAQRLSRVRAQHTGATTDPARCVICTATEFGYHQAVLNYTDPFGVKS